jgi:CelD/BcsL family acetyltransferase involved in cellulose biosynthesis
VLSRLNIEESYDIGKAVGQIFHYCAELETYIHLLEELSGEENPIRHVLDSLKPEEVVVLKDQYQDMIKRKMSKKTEKARRKDEKGRVTTTFLTGPAPKWHYSCIDQIRADNKSFDYYWKCLEQEFLGNSVQD